MKKSFFYPYKTLATYLLIASISLISCKKLIQIPPNPATQITRQEQFQDTASALSAVATVYTLGLAQGFPFSDANLTISTALSGHEITSTATGGDNEEFYNYSLNAINSEIIGLWSNPYTSIYPVNDIIAGVNSNSNLSASFSKQITGEMEVVRAFYYFNMVNQFGGVPLITTTDYTKNSTLSKANSTAIYAQILADLGDAVKKLTAAYPSAGHIRPNLYTAVTLQAKVHLYQGNWQAAYNEADSVIRYGGFSLEPDPNSVFLDGSVEAIWQLPVERPYFGTSEATSFMPYESDITPSYAVTDSLLNQFEPGDLRFTDWLGKNIVNGNAVYYPFKYKDLLQTTPATDFMLFRLAEVYLIRAEAAAQLNNVSVAISDINTIRNRATLAASTVTTASPLTAILAAIRKERRTEMCFEWGNRWFDLIRTSADSKYPASGQIKAVLSGYQSFNAVFPIPLAQLQSDYQLTQNPEYH